MSKKKNDEELSNKLELVLIGIFIALILSIINPMLVLIVAVILGILYARSAE